MTQWTADERDVALAAVRAYFGSRTFGLSPVSSKRAVAAIRPIVGDRPTNEQLLGLIAQYAIDNQIPLDLAAG